RRDVRPRLVPRLRDRPGALPGTGRTDRRPFALSRGFALELLSRSPSRRPGALGECETRTQGVGVAGGYGRDRGRRIAPPSAAGQPVAYFETGSKVDRAAPGRPG